MVQRTLTYAQFWFHTNAWIKVTALRFAFCQKKDAITQVIDLYRNVIHAFFAGNVRSACVFKALQGIRDGYQQSYPQKLWKYTKLQKNQSLAPHNEPNLLETADWLPQFRPAPGA